jgi:hypothetical protein
MFAIYRSPEAMAPLRETWENADDSLRRAILEASHRLDRQLHKNPHKRGESRDGRTRILFQAPIAVTFEIDEEKKLIRILRSWLYCPGANGQRRCG